jgi:hypothetical protein
MLPGVSYTLASPKSEHQHILEESHSAGWEALVFSYFFNDGTKAQGGQIVYPGSTLILWAGTSYLLTIRSLLFQLHSSRSIIKFISVREWLMFYKWLHWSKNLLSGGSMKPDRIAPNYKEAHKIPKWTYRSNLSLKKNNAISHLNSFPVMEFNYDYTYLKLHFQEFKENLSGIWSVWWIWK